MKLRTIVFTIALGLIASTAAFAVTPHIGTWKLNEAKSKFAAGATKNHTVVYEAAGSDIKVIVDGTAADGSAIHNEWTGKFDGKYYTVSGDASADMRSYRRVNARTLSLKNQKDGKVTLTATIVVSANGKHRTVTTWGTDADGKKVMNVAVYDKE
jgi:hypothetical protein